MKALLTIGMFLAVSMAFETAQAITCPPLPPCAAPPAGCRYLPVYDSNQCMIGCGTLVCASARPSPTFSPKPSPSCLPPPPCPAPPAGCKYIPVYDLNRCLVGCGTLACPTSTPRPAPTCPPPPPCAAPPAGCKYIPVYDLNKCLVGCGTLVCPSASAAPSPVPTTQICNYEVTMSYKETNLPSFSPITEKTFKESFNIAKTDRCPTKIKRRIQDTICGKQVPRRARVTTGTWNSSGGTKGIIEGACPSDITVN